MKDRYFAFISYKSEDRPVADALLAALEQRGLACWMAPRNINTGADYGEQILQGIRDASILVLVFSGRTNNSKYCPREVESAVRYGRRIFPIRIDSSAPNGSMEFQLSGVQWLEAQGESNWEKVAEQLAKAFDRTDTPIRTGPMPTINGIKPYQFGGKEYYNTEQLAVALSENWDAGVKNFGRGFVSEWVKVDLRNHDLASRLMDIHENKELDPNEKLSVALMEMDPKLPGMWRGSAVSREWAARAMQEFQELLQSRIRPRLEKLNGWPDDLVNLVKQLAEVKSEELSPEHLAAIERMVRSGDGRLILNGREIDEELLQGDPALGAELLNGKLPKLCAKYGDPRRWKQWMSRWAIVKDLEEQLIAVLYPAVISEKRGPKVGNCLLTIDWLEANSAEGRRLLSKLDFCLAHSELTGEKWLMEAGQRWRRCALRVTGKQVEWLWSWSCTTKPELKQEGAALTQQQLASNAIEGVLLLEGPLPGFWAEKTGETWLAEAASRWIDLWPQVYALGCGTFKSAALPWIIGPAAALQERAGQLLQQYAGAKDERLDRLWNMDSLGTAECVVLCAAIENILLTPKAKILSDGLHHLRGFLVEADWKEVADWEVAKQLITANDWEAVQKRWEEVLSDVEMNKHLKRNPKLRAVLENAQPEYLDVVAVCAIYGPTTRALLRDRRRFEMQQVEDQKQPVKEQKIEREVVQRSRRNRIITGAVAVFKLGIISLVEVFKKRKQR